ncbi:orexigenic neuropeptide QRFP [Erinaceus europaeus]|uniref:Orexigenic neuropeptide QRFP n=1 Tax=Erinaceus europaeus TaxID=9365 RepID=A0A1S3A737_ERIEU|nr:orexigenic neuropeptide QRFP [Erinaceus europaeus]
MMSPRSLSYLLLLPLGACFPLQDREEPVGAMGGLGDQVSWADRTGEHHFSWGPSRWRRAPAPPTLLMVAKELQTSGRERAGFRFRFGRQDDSSEAAGFLQADGGEKASGPLGTLAEELNGYSRKKGGFSFRFGRR